MDQSKYILFVGLLFILVLIILQIVSKSRRKKKEISLYASDKLREEELDRLLINDKAGLNPSEMFSAKPIEINYSADNQNLQSRKWKRKGKNHGTEKLMVHITEISALSKKRYVLNPEHGILIGSKQGKNDIVVLDEHVEQQQCQLVKFKNKIYVRNIGKTGNVILQRGKKFAKIRGQSIAIYSGDILRVGNIVLKIDLEQVKT